MDGLVTGRIVHYDGGDGAQNTCRAAVIVQIWDTVDGMANLFVFPDGLQEQGGVKTSVAFGVPVVRNPTWHWPERA
jgi:hypothetical protein